ncbi:MAG: SRPBCC domain-containing protein, partial [Pararhodobacter sp.]|nr:SRPBCC domain-containing protein [Pararhodobacter sp.]
QWMLGPDGWEMTICESDGTAGGTMHFEWANAQGDSFSLTGETVEAEPPHRMVHVERMHLPDPTPDNHVETLIEAEGDGCCLTLIMTLPDAVTRDAMLDTGMAEGMEASYARLDALIAR